jgi:hypothetical protein
VFVLLTILGVAACGGGGGGGGGTPPVTNAAPVMQTQTFAATEDTVFSGQLAATDPGDTLSFSATANPAHGALVVSANGAFTFTPTANYSGADTFQARVSDSRSQSQTTTMTVNVAAVNDAPVATDDVFTVTATDALAVLANDQDSDGDALTVAVIGTPSVGTATVGAGGVVSIATPAGFKGMTRFAYRVTDAGGVTANANAVVFVGVAPFKAIFQGRSLDDAGSPIGVFVNDFLHTSRAHPSLAPGSLGQYRYATDGTAIALDVDFFPAGERQLSYVQLAHPDVMRDISPRLAFGTGPVDTWISGNGRYVVYQLHDAAVGDALWLFDAQAAGVATRLTDPAVLFQSSQVAFNATSTRIYFVGRQQLTQSTSTNAVYRADLGTRAITRVTPIIPGASGAIDSFLVTPDETRVVASRVLTGIPRNIYLSDTALPDVETRLHEATANSDYTSIPVMSPNGATVVMQISHGGIDPAQLRLASTSAPGGTTPVGSTLFQRTAFYATGDRPYLMRADSLAALVLGGCDTVANPGGACDAYEIAFDMPGSPARVNVAAVPGTNINNPKYSRDGRRIAYLRRSSGVSPPASQLQVTRRSALGAESIELTPADQPVSFYELDPDGYSAMVLVGNEDLSLVSLDAQQTPLPVGKGMSTVGTAALLPR